MNKIRTYITPTTHWDREWIMAFGQYQVRLVNMMDNLIKIMKNNPEYRFLLDGQAIALEDYLEIKPEQYERISHFLKNGQLVAGPWYVLADQFLENGESMIRNLIFGMDKVGELGGRPMMLGYTPDSFGCIASMPMLLKGFGIEYMTFGRGRPYWSEELPKYEFWWESSDGSRILAANHGYGNGVFLSYLDIWTDIMHVSSLNPDPELVLKRFLEEASVQRGKAATSNLYFSVGVDHMEPRPSLPALVNYINAKQDKYELVYGIPEDYLKAVEKHAENLPVYIGEMRGSEENQMDLIGTLSTHMSLKQMNDDCEIMVQRVIEPLWLMVFGLCGTEYPKGHLKKIWKLLLLNQPHDSICGCSLDQVYKDILNRYEQIQSICDYLLKDGLHQLLSQIDTKRNDSEAVVLTVVNPLGRKHSGPVKCLVRVPMRFRHSDYYLEDFDGHVIPSSISHIKDKIKDLESVYMTNYQLATVLSKDASPQKDDEQIFTILEVDFIAKDIPQMGYKSFLIKTGSPGVAYKPGVDLCEQGMENGFIKVIFNDNGTFDLIDKRTKYAYKGLNYFVDREETGDSYDHHEFSVPAEFDSRKYTVDWQVYEQEVHRITFKAILLWELPNGLQGDKRSETLRTIPISIFATLYADSDGLQIAVEMDNACKDHCLRVVFDTGLDTGIITAYDHFNVIERKVRETGLEWRDEPFQEFVDASDGIHGICVSTRGLPAYEAVKGENGTRLYFTLLRSVGRVGSAAGADYLLTVAQCQGEYRFEYILIPHEGDWLKGDCMGKASDYRTPFLVEADVLHDGILPPEASFITLECEGYKDPFISCLKRAENDKGIILRLWNQEKFDRIIGLKSVIPLKEIYLTLLDESIIENIEAEAPVLKMKERGITTVRLII